MSTGLVARVRDVSKGVSTLTWVGFGLVAGFLGFAAWVVAGYGLTDPGGWSGVGLTALWMLPMLALVVLAVYRPGTAIPVLAAAAVLPVAFGVWTLVDYDTAMAWEDRTGPVSLMLVLVVGLPLAVAGLSRPTAAGALLLTITVVPWVVSIVGAGDDWGRALSIGLVTLPVVAGGVLLLLAGRFWTGAGAHLRPRRPLPGH